VALSLSPRVILAALWLACCGVWLVWSNIDARTWLGVPFGAVILVATLGVLMKWRWSQWVIYVLVAWGTCAWLYFLWESARAGYFPLETIQRTVLSLIPGISILAASIWSAYVVWRRFRKTSEQA
jgi:hypothetical protein